MRTVATWMDSLCAFNIPVIYNAFATSIIIVVGYNGFQAVLKYLILVFYVDIQNLW